MFAAAAIAGILGLIGLVWGLLQKSKASRLTSVPFAKTGDAASKGAAVADPKGALSVEGEVKCAAPLIAPASGTPCLYYELEVVGKWKEGDQTQSKDYLKEKKAAPFSVNDGSGPVAIVADQGGDFEPLERTFEETKKEGFLADLKSVVGKGEPIRFGKFEFANPPMSKADKFTCTERVMKVQPRLFVLGKQEAGRITSPKWRSLIMDRRSREVLIGATTKSAKTFLIGGASVLLAGIVLGVVSLVIAPAESSAAPQETTAVVVDSSPADTAQEAKAVQPSEPQEAPVVAEPETGTCARAVKCCKAATGGGPGASACENLAQAPEASCQTSLDSFKKAVKATKPARIADCN